MAAEASFRARLTELDATLLEPYHGSGTPRFYDKQAGEWKDGESLFLTCQAWRQMAEHVGESVAQGTRVIVTGRLRQRSYETKEGEKRTVDELAADDLAVSLLRATVKINKVTRASIGNSGEQAQSDPWANEGTGGYSDEPPF